jgi:hypothetical protein
MGWAKKTSHKYHVEHGALELLETCLEILCVELGDGVC